LVGNGFTLDVPCWDTGCAYEEEPVVLSSASGLLRCFWLVWRLAGNMSRSHLFFDLFTSLLANLCSDRGSVYVFTQ